MAAQSEEPPAVAPTEDYLSSPAVAGESSASGSGEWSKIDCPHKETDVTIASISINYAEATLLESLLDQSMEAHSQASPLPCETSEPKKTTAEPIAEDTELSASVGKAAGASSAVADMAPTAVEESSNQADLPEQRAAIPAPGSAAEAPPPPLPNVRPHEDEDEDEDEDE